MALDADLVATRVAQVRQRLERAGGHGVNIVAVTKGFGPEAVRAVVTCGLSRIGENYAQETLAKVDSLADVRDRFELHFIGQLQSNKIRSLAGVVDVWQSVDRASLVAELARRAPGARVLLQVNAAGEAGKAGCRMDQLGALVDAARAAGLAVAGLMTVGPTDQDPVRTRRAFAATRAAVDRWGLSECSMGMSHDLEIAVAEGATMVRVGTALFGQRSYER